MKQTIEISTNLYQRLGAHTSGFETPANVIERLLDYYEGIEENTKPTASVTPLGELPVSLEIVYYPSDEESFKHVLLQKKVAYLLLHKVDGTKDLKEWNASNFQPHSSVNGNLRSGYLRGWKNKGIVKAEISTDRSDLS